VPDERYVSVRLAADGLGRSVRTIRTWVAQGVVRALRDERGGVWVFAPDLPLEHATRGRRDRVGTSGRS
jgi:hypothetical protein